MPKFILHRYSSHRNEEEQPNDFTVTKEMKMKLETMLQLTPNDPDKQWSVIEFVRNAS